MNLDFLDTPMSVTTEKRKAPGKHNARIAAVQAMYQMEISGRGAAGVIDEFLEERLSGTPEFLPSSEIDRNFFARLVKGVVKNQEEVDQAIRSQLSEKWRLSRIDATLRAILRCCCFELTITKAATPAVVIDEYVEISNQFFDQKETGFINASLDAINKSFMKSAADLLKAGK